jgi:hypothetical protein
MEISLRTSANLLLLNDIPTEELRLICKFFLKSLVTGSSASEMDKKLESPLCALSTLLLEAGKLRAPSETLRFATALCESALKS